MFPSNTLHGGNYLIVCKAAIDDGHVATEQKVGRVDLRININPAKKGESSSDFRGMGSGM